MKLATRIFAATLLVGSVAATAGSLTPLPSARSELDLNGTWRVTTPAGTADVTVPATIDFTFGTSTWRRTFVFPGYPSPPAVALLSIGGMVNHGRIRLNGHELGTTDAFVPHLIDVRDHIVVGGDNVLEIELDDRLTESTVPGGATHVFLPTHGDIAYTFPVAWANRPGIIRDVVLIHSARPVLADVKFEQAFAPDFSWVDVRARIRTAGADPARLHGAVMVGRDGVAEGQCLAVPVASGELECTMRIAQPLLWSPAQPNLHDVAVLLAHDGALVDAGTDRIGLRKFEARGTRFHLNGREIFLRGISRHDIYGANHFVADDWTVRQDLLRIKALGVNFVRAIHYPPSELLLRRADEIGLLVAEEIPAWANHLRPEVIASAGRMLAATLDRDANRTSLVMVLLATLNTNRPDEYLDTLTALARARDPSRLVSFIFDDSAHTPAAIAANVAYAKARGADFYAQNCYWHSAIYQEGSAGFPADMPFLNTEWSGAEGSDRGPIGSGDTAAFPSVVYPFGGTYPETFSAWKMNEAFAAFYPYVCTPARPARCLAGTVYFNWQDVDWPGMPYFYPEHYPVVRNGLVYEDRVQKDWPMAIFQYFHTVWLPQ